MNDHDVDMGGADGRLTVETCRPHLRGARSVGCAVAVLVLTACGSVSPSTAAPSTSAFSTAVTPQQTIAATVPTASTAPTSTIVTGAPTATGAAPNGTSATDAQVVTAATTVQRVGFDATASYEWEQRGSVRIDQASVGDEFVLTLADPIESILGEVTIDADGSATIEFAVPAGTPPGTRRLIVRDGSTGRNIAATTIGVTAPGNCITDDPAHDRDGDLVIDDCDSSDLDGPIADFDGDGVSNLDDNCPQESNPDQARVGDRSAGSACDTKQGYNSLDVLQRSNTVNG